MSQGRGDRVLGDIIINIYGRTVFLVAGDGEWEERNRSLNNANNELLETI